MRDTLFAIVFTIWLIFISSLVGYEYFMIQRTNDNLVGLAESVQRYVQQNDKNLSIMYQMIDKKTSPEK